MTTPLRSLQHYFLACYLLVLAVCFPFLESVEFRDLRTDLFAVAVYLTYGFLYLLPAVVLTFGVYALAALLGRAREGRGRAADAVALLTTGLTLVFLITDMKTFQIFGYHVNGFVLNLIMTPGGIESMGMTTSSEATVAGVVVGLFALLGALLYGIRRTHAAVRGRLRPRKLYRYLLAAFLALTVGERLTYGISHIQARSSVLVAASAFPLYLPLTFRDVAKSLGYTPVRHDELRLGRPVSRLTYPLAPLDVEPPDRPLNVVWLVAESLRADVLDPEIMPATWEFARGAHRFTNHYSGSNSTRMGVFTMFYGLYGPYWFACLDAQRGPVLMDVLQAQGYQMGLFTSARFSYPEFDKTVFVTVPTDRMQAYSKGAGWERDRKNVGDMLAFIEGRDPSAPFFTFMFFESAHASYYFPPESVVRTPYLKDLNYATMSLDTDIALMKNRYINSVHHLDSQFGRILDSLREQEILDDTIVVITGDHGEEFMEKGRWGHGSTFTEEQTRSPMVIWIPGTGSGVYDFMTSHLDVPATIMPHLGVRNPPADYSLGYDMLGDEHRRYTVVAHWHTVGYVGDRYKAVFAFHKAASLAAVLGPPVTTAQDEPVTDTGPFYAADRANLLEVMQDLARFGRRN